MEGLFFILLANIFMACLSMEPGGKIYDFVLLTDSRYVFRDSFNWYIQNIFDDELPVIRALEERGMRVWRTNWDNPDFDWSSTRYVVFRSTWDYFDRYPEFSKWFESVAGLTSMINPYDIIRWNMDKHYLRDLASKGINVPPTIYIEPEDPRTLQDIMLETGWEETILKPCISGTARHTYRLHPDNVSAHEPILRELIASESMMLQEFQRNVIPQGEMALVVLGGDYSHAVLKKAKEGDFRVHEDFGGSVEKYMASKEEIDFAVRAVSVCNPQPAYARVDTIRDNNGDLCVSELELIEPELWFRFFPDAAESFADAIMNLAGLG